MGVPDGQADRPKGNRRAAGDKRQRYSLARGECGELASAVELAAAYNLLIDKQVTELLELAGRTNAMLLRLEQRFGGVKP